MLAICFGRVKSEYKTVKSLLYYSEIKERPMTEKKNTKLQKETICKKSNVLAGFLKYNFLMFETVNNLFPFL